MKILNNLWKYLCGYNYDMLSDYKFLFGIFSIKHRNVTNVSQEVELSIYHELKINEETCDFKLWIFLKL